MKKFPVRCSVTAVLLAVAIRAHAGEEVPARAVWAGSIAASFSQAQVDGFLQTPAGGAPGTSSYRRPSLKELNIDDVDVYDVQASMQFDRLQLYAGYQTLKMDSSATLAGDLISRGIAFPAGTQLRSDTEINWIRAGAGWEFNVLPERWTLTPKAELGVLDFNYKLHGGAETAGRRYAQATYRVGLESQYRFNPVVSAVLDAGASLPIPNSPQITVLAARLEFELGNRKRQLRPLLFLGAGMQRIDYEDEQDLANHIRVEMEPLFTIGLKIAF